MDLLALCLCFAVYGWAMRASISTRRRRKRYHRRVMKVVYLYH